MTFDEEVLQQFYRYSYALTGESQSAYDLLQSALEKYLRLKTVPDYPMAYMKRMIRNQFIDEYRRAKNLPMDEFDETQDVPQQAVERTLERAAISADLVRQVFAYLSPAEREILYFWAVEGMTTIQIAEQLQMPKGTVLSRIHRMRLRLQAHFGEDYSDGMMEVAS